ncbi:MAG: helix-turn-helix transcriptional regulator [Tissierella sp.]|nr:helix-turn-helix transcriptional regulator [Tissierella sp.]
MQLEVCILLGDKIRQLREERNLNQLELAKSLNISNTTLSQYESGNRTPSDEIKKAIAEYFNVSLDYLMGASNVRNPYKDNKEEIYPAVNDVEEAMKIILDQPGLMLKGELLSDESKIILANAIQMGLRTAEELERKSKGEDNE